MIGGQEKRKLVEFVRALKENAAKVLDGRVTVSPLRLHAVLSKQPFEICLTHVFSRFFLCKDAGTHYAPQKRVFVGITYAIANVHSWMKPR